MRWTRSGKTDSNDISDFYLGGNKHERGVEIMLNNEAAQTIVLREPVLDRVITAWLQAGHSKANIHSWWTGQRRVLWTAPKCGWRDTRTWHENTFGISMHKLEQKLQVYRWEEKSMKAHGDHRMEWKSNRSSISAPRKSGRLPCRTCVLTEADVGSDNHLIIAVNKLRRNDI